MYALQSLRELHLEPTELCNAACRCGHCRVLSVSCKQRLLCPTCSAKRAVLFAEHLVEEVLKSVDHRAALPLGARIEIEVVAFR